MILKKIKIKNIRSYKEAEIEFPVGSTLLMGDIGCGKTSVLLAIEFALFGLQPGQKANSLLRTNETEAQVTLEIEIEDKTIIIERGLEKSGKSIGQSDVAVTINQDRIEGSVTEVKNKILSLLNYPPEFAKKTNDLYKFTVYTPQEEMKQIILEPSETRLNTLRHIFGIDKYKRIEENLDIITSKMRQDIRVKEAEIGNTEHKKTSIEEKKVSVLSCEKRIQDTEIILSQVRIKKSEKQKEIDELSNKILEKNKLETEKAKSEVMLVNKKESLNTLERESIMLKDQIKNISQLTFKESEFELIKTHIKSQEEILKNINEAYIACITNIQRAEGKAKDLRTLKDKISALDKCPTCLQIVEDMYKNNIVSKAIEELAITEREILENKKSKEENQRQIEAAKRQIESLKNSLSEMEILRIKLESVKEKQRRIDLIATQINTTLQDIDMMKKHSESLAQLIQDYKAYDFQFEQKNKEMRLITNEENSLLIKKAEINKEIQMLKIQIQELENELTRIALIEKKLAYMKELEFWLNNKFLELVLHTEKNVMLKLREDFSKLLSDWFSILVSENLSVRLDESFSPVIQQNDYEIDYNYLSGGERTAVALAYRLSLNQTINSMLSKIQTRDLVILDEPTDGFSESQLDKMRDIFNQLKVKQLIIVSHEHQIEGFVENVIRFKKVDGVTQVEKEI